MTIEKEWLSVAISLGVYLVGGGVFVGIVKTTIGALTLSINRLEKRMDGFDGFSDGSIGSSANLQARVTTLEREMAEIRNLRDLVIRHGERQDLQNDATNKSLTALENRVDAAMAMFRNQAIRDGAIKP